MMTVPAPAAVTKPVLGSTVAEPLPALTEKINAPPRPPVAVLVANTIKVRFVANKFAEVIVSVGVALSIVMS